MQGYEFSLVVEQEPRICVAWGSNPNTEKKNTLGEREKCQWLRALAASAEDLVLFPKHTWWLTTMCNSTSGNLMASWGCLFGLCKFLYSCDIHRFT